MKKRLVLKPYHVITFILFWTIISNTLIDEFEFNPAIRYLNDIAWVILLLFILKCNLFSWFKKYNLKSILFAIWLLVGICLFSAMINWVNPLLLLWAIRNTFRFFVFYIACVLYLNADDVDRIFDVFLVIQIVSFFIALYQYFELELYMDTLGGIFGHGNGGALNTFQAMLVAYFMFGYLQKKQPIYKLAITLVTAVIIAAMAEEKAFFVYVCVIVVGGIVISKPSMRTIFLIFGSVIMIPIGFHILVTINGEDSLKVLLDYETSVKYMDEAYELSRLNPFSQINEMIFKDDIIKNIFGIGFGGAESIGSTELLTSDFYEKYSYLNYYSFTHQKKFVETGYLGFGAFIAFFVFNIVASLRGYIGSMHRDYRLGSSACFGMIAILSCWFSGALIFNDAYLIFFGVAVGNIIIKSSTSNG